MSTRAMIAEDMILMPRKRKRPVISCTECHRRKKKCDRQQPCLNCAKRGLQGFCSYEPANEPTDTIIFAGPGPISDDVHPAFASEAPLPSPTSGIATVSQPSPTKGLQALSHLGYANDKTGTRAILESIGGRSMLDAPESSLADHAALQYRALIRQLPPNIFVGKLVRLFFAKVGWHYDIVDESDFWEQLSTWENVSYVSRSQPHKLDPAVRYFPSLLFQILAQALLFQPARHESFLDDMKHTPDMDLVDLAAEFSDTGQQILSLFGARDSALVKVQAGLQRACFLKTAGSVVEAWHVLGRAIKDAQELGLHQCGESPDPEFSENLPHARHMGAHHRVWLVLHLWDAHMAVVLGRPMATTLDPGTVPFPHHYSHHQDLTAQANRIRPFDLILCGYHMAYKHLQEIHQLDPMKPGASDTVQRIQDAISTNLCHMPAWARYESPVQDKEHPWLPGARETLITEVNFTSLALHRPLVFAYAPSRAKALHASLQVLQSQRRLFDAAEPSDFPAFDLVFATFDAAVIIAAIYIRFPGENIVYLHQSLQAVEWALERLDVMKSRNTLAASAFVTLTDVYRKFQRRTPSTSYQATLDHLSTAQSDDAVKQMLLDHPTDIGHQSECTQTTSPGCDSILTPSPLRDLVSQDLSTLERAMYLDGVVTNIAEELPTAGHDFWHYFNDLGA